MSTLGKTRSRGVSQGATVPEVGRADKVAALAFGLYGSANIAQGVSVGTAEAILRPMTFVLLPIVLAVSLYSAVTRPERLRGTLPCLFLVAAVLPTFGQPALQATYLEPDATPLRVLVLICLPLWGAALVIRSSSQVPYLVSGLLTGAIVVAVGLISNPLRDTYNNALQAGQVDTISTGVACVLGSLLLLWWALGETPLWSRLVLFVGAVAFGYATLLTLSRQATLVLALGVPLVALGRRRSGRKSMILLLGATFVAATAIWFGFAEGRLAANFNRPVLWGPALDAIATNLQGVGWGNYATVSGAQAVSEARYPHNLMIQALLEGGLIFGLALLGVLICAASCAWRLRRMPDGALIGILWLVLLMSSLVSSDITGARALAVLSGGLLGLKLGNGPGNERGGVSSALVGQPRPGAGPAHTRD